ncbi:DUF6309 family protein [Streptomyces sp. NBC_01429]|uniref:DUF6309 family protein n=1 Tax=Streptomyces sp. NBC_01429 TaxID=2903862 RepID=UPI002E280B60|nr:DUF6309 family protein [Streptomyces sp. NBC_01429]
MRRRHESAGNTGMKVLEAVTFDTVMGHFAQAHPYDGQDEANSNDEAEAHIRNAQQLLGGRWHRVLLADTEVLDVVLPWHLGEDGEVELIPPAGLTVGEAAARLAALGESYARTNPLCARKLDRQTHAPPTPVFLATAAMPGPDYARLTVREGLIHLDGLHRLLAWRRAGRPAPGDRIEAYVAGLGPADLSPADVRHGTRHDQEGLDVHPGR